MTDFLPPGWDYVVGTDTSTIVRPDKTTVSANPTKTGTGPYIAQLDERSAGHETGPRGWPRTRR